MQIHVLPFVLSRFIAFCIRLHLLNSLRLSVRIQKEHTPPGTHTERHTLTAVRWLQSLGNASKISCCRLERFAVLVKIHSSVLTSLCLLSTEAPAISKVLIGCCFEVRWPISTVEDNFTLCALITVWQLLEAQVVETLVQQSHCR